MPTLKEAAQRVSVAQRCAQLLQSILNCEKSGNWEWRDRHTTRLEKLVREAMPSGSGFDAGTTLDMDQSTPERLVFTTSFHHMDESGGYDGWTDHRVSVRPSLVFSLLVTVSGRDRNQIKDYIAETFHSALTTQAPEIADD